MSIKTKIEIDNSELKNGFKNAEQQATSSMKNIKKTTNDAKAEFKGLGDVVDKFTSTANKGFGQLVKDFLNFFSIGGTKKVAEDVNKVNEAFNKAKTSTSNVGASSLEYNKQVEASLERQLALIKEINSLTGKGFNGASKDLSNNLIKDDRKINVDSTSTVHTAAQLAETAATINAADKQVKGIKHISKISQEKAFEVDTSKSFAQNLINSDDVINTTINKDLSHVHELKINNKEANKKIEETKKKLEELRDKIAGLERAKIAIDYIEKSLIEGKKPEEIKVGNPVLVNSIVPDEWDMSEAHR